MQVAVVATARKLATLCWHLVVGEQDYAFQRPSLTTRSCGPCSCAPACRPGAARRARRGQKGPAAAYSCKEVRRRERALAEQAEAAYRQLATEAASDQAPVTTRSRGAWPPTTGARRLALKGRVGVAVGAHIRHRIREPVDDVAQLVKP
jgi:transposase